MKMPPWARNAGMFVLQKILTSAIIGASAVGGGGLMFTFFSNNNVLFRFQGNNQGQQFEGPVHGGANNNNGQKFEGPVHGGANNNNGQKFEGPVYGGANNNNGQKFEGNVHGDALYHSTKIEDHSRTVKIITTIQDSFNRVNQYVTVIQNEIKQFKIQYPTESNSQSFRTIEKASEDASSSTKIIEKYLPELRQIFSESPRSSVTQPPPYPTYVPPVAYHSYIPLNPRIQRVHESVFNTFNTFTSERQEINPQDVMSPPSFADVAKTEISNPVPDRSNRDVDFPSGSEPSDSWVPSEGVPEPSTIFATSLSAAGFLRLRRHRLRDRARI